MEHEMEPPAQAVPPPPPPRATPPPPKPTEHQDHRSNPNNIDLGAILLPTKEVHTPASAQRVSAGVLLQQEKTAQLPRMASPAPVVAPASTPQKPDHSIAPLETYKGDIEKYVREKNVSVISAAAAQAQQHTNARSLSVSDIEKTETKEKPAHSWGFYIGLVGGGIVCIMLALGLIFFVSTRTGQLPVAPALQAPFIAVDGVVDIPITPGESRADVLANLEQARTGSTLALGLIEQLRPVVATSTNTVELVGAQPFLALLAPTIPANLLRTIGPMFLLGAHTFSTLQPFIILKTDSYEEAFSGMLTWEETMQSDLLPLFAYTPSPHLDNGSVATSTPTQSGFSQSGFVDAIVENHDARVLKNNTGDIYFLWTFVDRTTIVITTQEYTLREVISRLKDAPILTQPGQ